MSCAHVRHRLISAALEQRKRVVVIGEDDEPAYQAVIVPDGALVLETVRQVHADLLILDVMMPGLSGIEVFDRVRAEKEIRDMPVLYVTAASLDFERQFKDRKIADVIAKPFDLNQL